MATDYEIVIVGGGPAGISTWLHLHDRDPRLAARAVVIEQSKHPRDKICGGGVTWPGDRQLEFLDAHVDVESVAIHRMHFRFGDELLELGGDDAIRVVRRREFDAELTRVAVRRGMEIHEGVGVRGVSIGDGHATLQTTGADYRARVVVGADGAQSTVRSRAGLADEGGLSRLLKTVTPRRGGPEDDREAHTVEFDFTAVASGLQGYVWHFPCIENGCEAVDHGVYDSRVRRGLSRADLSKIFGAALVGAGLEVDPSTWLSCPVRPFAPGSAIAGPHVVLAGDAAGIDPILGEGISQSIRHGDVAADALVDAFDDGDFSMASYGDRLVAHELGQSLVARHDLAQKLYAFGQEQHDERTALFRSWLRAGLP